jgi:hypothetical protein
VVESTVCSECLHFQGTWLYSYLTDWNLRADFVARVTDPLCMDAPHYPLLVSTGLVVLLSVIA